MFTERITTSPPLAPKLIEAAQPREKDYELPDSAAPGLCLRITKVGKDGRSGGSKVFRWYVTSLGRVITIGRWSKTSRPGYVTLAEARTWLERLKEAHKAGTLEEVLAELEATRPARGRAAREATAAAEVAPLTVKLLAADFMKHIERRRKRPEPVRSVLDADLLPALGDRPVASITPLDVRHVVDAVVARGAATHAGKVLAIARQLFRFAQGRSDVASNPAEPLDADALGVVNNICDRYLLPDEIGAFWQALDKVKGMTPTVRIALRLLLLLGVRSGELLQAEWSEVDFDAATWTVPVEHQKLTRKQEREARPFVVPLAPAALELFRQLEAAAKSIGGSRYVLASFHGAGAPLTEKSLNHAMRRLFTGETPALKFEGERPTPHDLRRTMRTYLGDKLGVPPHVAERCLNHSLGRIAKTYDQGDYLAERRAALEKWSAYVERLVAPAEASVAFLPAAAVRAQA
ncbi:MAG TPA: tyrosine-type recombinase/integrase [Anaeromyxobacteraceae bacterium]